MPGRAAPNHHWWVVALGARGSARQPVRLQVLAVLAFRAGWGLAVDGRVRTSAAVGDHSLARLADSAVGGCETARADPGRGRAERHAHRLGRAAEVAEVHAVRAHRALRLRRVGRGLARLAVADRRGAARALLVGVRVEGMGHLAAARGVGQAGAALGAGARPGRGAADDRLHRRLPGGRRVEGRQLAEQHAPDRAGARRVDDQDVAVLAGRAVLAGLGRLHPVHAGDALEVLRSARRSRVRERGVRGDVEGIYHVLAGTVALSNDLGDLVLARPGPQVHVQQAVGLRDDRKGAVGRDEDGGLGLARARPEGEAGRAVAPRVETRAPAEDMPGGERALHIVQLACSSALVRGLVAGVVVAADVLDEGAVGRVRDQIDLQAGAAAVEARGQEGHLHERVGLGEDQQIWLQGVGSDRQGRQDAPDRPGAVHGAALVALAGDGAHEPILVHHHVPQAVIVAIDGVELPVDATRRRRPLRKPGQDPELGCVGPLAHAVHVGVRVAAVQRVPLALVVRAGPRVAVDVVELLVVAVLGGIHVRERLRAVSCDPCCRAIRRGLKVQAADRPLVCDDHIKDG